MLGLRPPIWGFREAARLLTVTPRSRRAVNQCDRNRDPLLHKELEFIIIIIIIIQINIYIYRTLMSLHVSNRLD